RADLRANTANEAFYKTFKTTPDQTQGRLIYDLGDQEWNIPKLRMLLKDILPRNSFFDDFEVTHDFPQIGRRTMMLNARRLELGDGAPQHDSPRDRRHDRAAAIRHHRFAGCDCQFLGRCHHRQRPRRRDHQLEKWRGAPVRLPRPDSNRPAHYDAHSSGPTATK